MKETNIRSGSHSYKVQRILAAIAALPMTVFSLLVIRNQLRSGFDPIGAIFGSGVGMAAIICWWFTLRGHIAENRARIRFAMVGGLILGGIGFVAGFFGPIILTPNANQGPLLGIFVTGPLGFVLGAVIGWLYGWFHTFGPKSG
jgi:hypothetical protein